MGVLIGMPADIVYDIAEDLAEQVCDSPRDHTCGDAAEPVEAFGAADMLGFDEDTV